MSDGSDDRGSPWLRDDWTAPPARAFIDDPPVEQRSTGGGRTSTLYRSRPRAARIGVAVCVAVVVVLVVVMFTRDESNSVDTDVAAPSDVGDLPGETLGSSDIPTSAPSAVADADRTPEATAAAEALGVEREADIPPTTSVARFVVGEAPVWTESTVDVPSPLAEMTEPTDVVVKSNSGLIHRIDLPSGRVRSLDASELGRDFQLVVGRTAIVAHNAREFVLLRDDLPTVSTSIPDGLSIIGARPGRDDFVVVLPGDERQFGERELILGVDGQLSDAPTTFAELPFWATFFLPSGDLVVNRPGGVYAIGDDGTAVRIDEGELLAVGARHYAVERCSSTLECEVAVVETASGATTIVDDAIAGMITPDLATSLSPDGASVLYIDYQDDLSNRRVVSLASAVDGVSIGGVDQLLWPDSWATDSSGVFTEVLGVLRFTDRVTGAVTEFGRELIDDGAGAASVAARPGA